MRTGERCVFRTPKYAAFHLMLARWLRHHGTSCVFRYVTLGGTELKDVCSLHFIDTVLSANATSFETDAGRFEIATETAERLQAVGVEVRILPEDIFAYKRQGELPHLFFVDLCGICSGSDYPERFAEMLERRALREGDALLITSYLGRNPGWEKIFAFYENEFTTLGVTDKVEKRNWYRRAHPSFTLYRALALRGLEHEIALKCLGFIEYRGDSTMGLYGYVVLEGTTGFSSFVSGFPQFEIR